MAYVIVNDFEGGTREQYDATTAVVHPPGGLPRRPDPSTTPGRARTAGSSSRSGSRRRSGRSSATRRCCPRPAGQSVLPGPPKTTEFEVEVEL